MQLSLKNAELEPMVQFIQSMTISGAQANRGRVRLTKLMQTKSIELVEERIEIAKKFTKLDEDGNPVIKDSKFEVLPGEQNEHDFNNAQRELLTSEAVINVDEYQQSLAAFYTALNHYDEKMDGSNAMTFGRLLDIMENSGFNEEE